MNIIEFQTLMAQLYIHRDRKRGLNKTMLWLISEIGELAEAIRLEDQDKIAEEMADVLAWLCSLANLANIDLENAACNKYPGQCARCNSKPCICQEG
ncbi:MAG: MazG nucleotide pyrophosphohydrolase domain-containing protein [Candidatus Thorarchaeota archaeon]